MPTKILYNSDSTNIFMDKAMTREKLLSYVDEAADAGADSYLLCQGAQTFFYPSKISEYSGQTCSEETRQGWDAGTLRLVENLELFLNEGIDPFELLVNRVRERDMEALFSFRLNEGHTFPVDHPNISRFWRDHPDWRLNSADPVPSTHRYEADDIRTRVMDFAVPQVRERRLAEIEEGMTNYDFDGLEIDFQRWPFFFKPEEITENIGTMTAFMSDLRSLLDRIGEAKERRLTLGVRVPPSVERSLAIGLDCAAWNRAGLLDFLTPATFFRGREQDGTEMDPDVAGFKAACPGLSVHGCIGIIPKDEYLPLAKRLVEAGADGIYLFNFFCFRQAGYDENPGEPPFHLLEKMRHLA